LGIYLGHGFQIRRKDDDVDPVVAVFLLEDMGNFAGQDEPGGRFIFLEFVQAVFSRRQAQPQLGEIIWMGEIAGAHEVDALNLSPFCQGLNVHVLAGGPAIFRMDMEVRYKFHIQFTNLKFRTL
jgi:hypothetical protein